MYNEEYANTLRSIANGGADAFYTGDIAYNIVDAIESDPNIPGDMTLEDLSNYQVIERPAVCATFKTRHVCGMGPPSSGGIGVGQILGILDALNQTDRGRGPLDSSNVHLFTQAMRLAFADRNQYIGYGICIMLLFFISAALTICYLRKNAGMWASLMCLWRGC